MSTQAPKPPAAAPAPAGPPPRPPPKNPGFVTCTIDGREVVVKPGTNMVQAALTVGSEIPFYCYHPRLSIAANCRMCLVEATGSPKLVPACQTALAEGMAVKTNTPKVKDQQRATLEFLLLNHPVDCAICDQSGECKLQDYYFKYNHQPSRLAGPKVLKNKRKVLGPQVVLDQERCILCTRCVRFMDEVAKEPQLGVFGRGSHERIDVFPGAALDSNYSGNTVDICPVGALLNRDFRFRARVWFLSATPSVCTGCSRGCNVFVDSYGQDTHRYRPRDNEQVNQSWMCDQGRLSYKQLGKGRVTFATVGRGPDAREAARAEVVKATAEKLRPLLKQPQLAVLASPAGSNEDLLAGLWFAKDVLGATQVWVGGRPDGEADHFLMTADKNPNRKGLEWIAKGLGLELKPFDGLSKAISAKEVRALVAVGTEVPHDAAEVEQELQPLELFVALAVNHGPMLNQADLVLPCASHVESEGSFVNLDGIIQRVRPAYPPRGDSQPIWKWMSDLSRELGMTTRWPSAREVFLQLAPKIPELAQFEWDKAAPAVKAYPGLNYPAAAADGRPPGYREYGVPRVRGI